MMSMENEICLRLRQEHKDISLLDSRLWRGEIKGTILSALWLRTPKFLRYPCLHAPAYVSSMAFKL